MKMLRYDEMLVDSKIYKTLNNILIAKNAKNTILNMVPGCGSGTNNELWRNYK